MNDKEINEYVNDLLSGKITVPGGLEADAFQQFRKLTADVAQASQRLQQVEAESTNLRTAIIRMNGQREAFATMLIKAEKARREAKDGLSLVDFKEKIGADRIQAVNNDGEVVGDTDPNENTKEVQASDPPTGK